MPALYIVGTPIGNLEDITFRAVRVLKEADIIAAEDTRHTKILLDRYSIKKPLVSYHKFNILERSKQLISEIKKGKNIALVSDAGMPGISDPGHELIAEAIKEGINVIPVPGASAFLVALSASGMSTDRFIFEGFLPAKGGERKKRLEELKYEAGTLILYEAPHRVLKTMDDIRSVMGERQVCIAREMTKKFEEFIRGTPSEMINRFTSTRPRGEFVILIEGAKDAKTDDIGDVKLLIAELLKRGMSRKDAVSIISKDRKIPKNKLYNIALRI